jgi:hypothetical protein
MIVGLALCGAAAAQGPDPTPNGCGSGWNTYLVPDYIPIAGCQLESSCNAHDMCYGKCLVKSPEVSSADCRYIQCRPGAALAGQAVCNSPEFTELQSKAMKRRQTCDRGFYDSLLTANPERPVCKAFAVLYRDMVVWFGPGSFFGVAPGIADAPEEIRIPQDSRDAIEEFFRKATPKQFEDFTKAMEAGTPTVDTSKPLIYDKQRGLVNRPP